MVLDGPGTLKKYSCVQLELKGPKPLVLNRFTNDFLKASRNQNSGVRASSRMEAPGWRLVKTSKRQDVKTSRRQNLAGWLAARLGLAWLGVDWLGLEGSEL